MKSNSRSDLREEVPLIVGHFVALTAMLAPLIGLLTLMQYLPSTGQSAVTALLVVAVVASAAVWAWKVRTLAGNLAEPDNLARLRNPRFQAWQKRHYMTPILPDSASLEELNIIDRHFLAARLYTYTREVTHTRPWERALRLLPKPLVRYVAIHGGTTKLFSIGRMEFVKRTGCYGADAWTDHVAAQVDAIYAT